MMLSNESIIGSFCVSRCMVVYNQSRSAIIKTHTHTHISLSSLSSTLSLPYLSIFDTCISLGLDRVRSQLLSFVFHFVWIYFNRLP